MAGALCRMTGSTPHGPSTDQKHQLLEKGQEQGQKLLDTRGSLGADESFKAHKWSCLPATSQLRKLRFRKMKDFSQVGMEVVSPSFRLSGLSLCSVHRVLSDAHPARG